MLLYSARCFAPGAAGSLAHLTVAEETPPHPCPTSPRAMETAYVSPRPRGTSRPETPRGHTPAGAEPSPPALLADGSPDGDGRRRGLGGSGPSVKKHHHKHNLKHRYELLETLGRGTYGKVKKAIERHSGREVSRHVTVKTPAPTTPAVPPTCACVCSCVLAQTKQSF